MSVTDLPITSQPRRLNTPCVIFTERQGQYLSFISQYMKVNGRSPAESDIQRYFGVSPPTVHQMVLKLESLGLITRKPGVARSIQVMVSSDDIPALK
jgi:DNA-binding MarR family transcriptional regulator